MRTLLLALCLASTHLLIEAPLSAQMVEESLAQDPGPLDFIQGDSYEQWILQSLAGDALVGIAPDGRLVPRLADRFDLGHHRELPERHHDGPVGLVTTGQMSTGVDDPVPAADVRGYRIVSTPVHADQAYDSDTPDDPRGVSR